MQVDANAPLTGITIQNLTFCGSGTLTNPNPSPVCPHVQTTCGNYTDHNTAQAMNNMPMDQPTCADLQIDNADSGTNPDNPFNNTGTYSVTIANCDLEDATGHAIVLYSTVPKKVNDVYIHDSAINSSEVTGIIVGVNGENSILNKVCDGNPNFSNDTTLHLPRNIRIEHNTFINNNTGATGMVARWVGMRNNTFTNNYINPQGGNTAGGTVFLDQCTDHAQVWSNTLTGPDILNNTSGLELWGRTIDATGNTVSHYPTEGIGASSTIDTTIQSNQTFNNGRLFSTGGILVETSGPGGPCDQIPRDSKTVNVNGNTSTGQAFGIYLRDRPGEDRATVNDLTIQGNNLGGTAILQDPLVVTPGYVGPQTTLAAVNNTHPEALAIDAVSAAI
jgi:hypothetical protein